MFKQIIPKVDTLFSPEELYIIWNVTDCCPQRYQIFYTLKIMYPKIYFKLTEDYIIHYHNLYLLSKDHEFNRRIERLMSLRKKLSERTDALLDTYYDAGSTPQNILELLKDVHDDKFCKTYFPELYDDYNDKVDVFRKSSSEKYDALLDTYYDADVNNEGILELLVLVRDENFCKKYFAKLYV